MNDDRAAPYAIWFLRLTLAIALLTHVEINAGAFDPAATMHWLGLPAGVPGFGIALELVVALALILGIWPRAAALAGAAVLLAAIVKTHGPAVLTGAHFHWAAPVVWIGALLLLSLAGDGAFTLVRTTTGHPDKEKQQ